ncbi:MAG: SET domain-containing protein [Verrucomicrobiales bacterium]|nr:SET domain-containing protein [Verrucomicrobiales bacterium]
MLHPATLVRHIDDEIGSGVFARTFLPRGTVVWVLDELDRVFTEAEVRQMAPAYQEVLERYCFRNDRAHWVFPWDNTRFVNHSFDPNCLGTQLGFEIAVRDIAAGEEITNDYGSLNIIEPFDCLPEAGSTRERVMPDDLLRHADAWDRLIAAAFPDLWRVPQPLARLFAPDRWEALVELSRSGAAPESLRHYYCGQHG